MAVSSVTQLCNNALLRLGADVMMNIDTDNTVTSTLCKDLYPVTRDSLLRQHFWNFAIVRLQLAAAAIAPIFEWSNSFPLPADFVRLVDIFEQSSPFKIEGNSLLTNDPAPLQIKYVSSNVSVTLFDPLFVDVLTLLMAVRMGPRLCGDGWSPDKLAQELSQLLLEAKLVTSQDTTPDELSITTFADGRYGSFGSWWNTLTPGNW